MKKKELVKAYANLVDLSLADAERILDTLPELILAVVSSGNEFRLPGVVSIGSKLAPPRRAYNFKTGEVGYVDSKPQVVLKAGSKLKEAVSNAPLVPKK